MAVQIKIIDLTSFLSELTQKRPYLPVTRYAALRAKIFVLET